MVGRVLKIQLLFQFTANLIMMIQKLGGWKGIFSSCTGITIDEICLIQGIK